MDTQQLDPAEFVTPAEFIEKHPSALLPTVASVHWTNKKHGGELVEKGVLIPGRGRAPALIHEREYPRAVMAIRQRRAA